MNPTLRLASLAAAFALAGCETAPIGMVCYVPHGQVGKCEVAPLAPPAPAPTVLHLLSGSPAITNPSATADMRNMLPVQPAAK
jgi:hypothetical protein